MSSFRNPSNFPSSRAASRTASRSSSTPPKEEPGRNQLDDIIAMWKRTVEGLYKAHPKTSFYFLDELKALCRGAGQGLLDPDAESPLLPLERALDYTNYGYKNNLLSLKLELNTPGRVRDDVIELLKAYCFEAGALDDIEEQLRRRQVPLREPTSDDDWLDTWELIETDVLQTAKKLMLFHARLQVLQYEIEKEALVNRSEDQLQWVYISELAYPVRHSRKSSAGVNSFHS
ncbi:hypothetical protein N3K66_005364 [Trichothecium roseum]|uniref:Uncharacterized protein n=1 Tax=Trichothecium roseum TaxID=47278 RepID=A0ACC0UXR3_9HYPO|nr:hypothetical protein N3K66_005364 [Trichothecium roseum]